MDDKQKNRIDLWRRELHKHASFEQGVIVELENHLLDEIENLKKQGYADEEAFFKAKEKLGDVSVVASEERKVQKYGDGSLSIGLVKSFAKAGSRYFRKNKLSSAINLVGLTLAFTSVLFISFFIIDEISFERHHPEYEKIYRLSYSFQEEDGSVEDRAYASGMWSELLKERSTLVTDQFRFLNLSYGYVFNPEINRAFYEEGIYWSDPNFFDFLNFKMKYGRAEDQLRELTSIVLTEKTAKKIFGDENPVGRHLQYRRTSQVVEFVVTGVIYDPPSNSHFQPDYIANMQAIQGIFGEGRIGWVDRNPRPGYVFTYVKIDRPGDVPKVMEQADALFDEIIPDLGDRVTPLLTPISSIHFNPPIKWEIDTPINPSYIYGLGIIGIFILVVALINFVSLTTAQGSKRQKEIGLRKTLGGTKRQLNVQFFLEPFFSILVAITLSLALSALLTPYFNILIGKNVDFFELVLSSHFLVVAVPTFLMILLTAGLLSAVYFTRNVTSSLNLNDLLKPSRSDTRSRNVMVTLQFVIAIILIIGTITIYQQLELINNGGLGRNRESVIGIRTSRMGDATQVQLYKSRIATVPGVVSNTLGEHLPKQTGFGRINTKYLLEDRELYWNKFEVDSGFLQTYELRLLAGRNFDRGIQQNAVLINESALKVLGLTAEESIGKYLREDSINYVFRASDGIIIGVVEDFVYKSIKEKIEPLVIVANNWVGGVLSVRLGTGNKLETISSLEKVWHEVYPGRPFEYWFLDKEFEIMYSQERRLGRLIPIFSGLAIIISLLGLFALTAYISDLRKKEIGIRKVLGCSTEGILRLLGMQYLKTLIPAILVSTPIAYLGMNHWLNTFSYRVDVTIGIILISVAAIVLVSTLTISFKTLSSALGNPVESLKYE